MRVFEMWMLSISLWPCGSVQRGCDLISLHLWCWLVLSAVSANHINMKGGSERGDA